MSKIIELQSENVQRLKAVRIKPGANVQIIGGNNGQGKTSVLQAIAEVFGGRDAMSEVPVRTGQKYSETRIELDSAEVNGKPIPGLVLKRRTTAGGTTTLTVETKEGARYPSPQAIVDAITSLRTFDPLSFILLKGDKQAQELKALVKLDTLKLDQDRVAKTDERKRLNAEIEREHVLAENMAHDKDAPAEEVSHVSIVEEIDKANAVNLETASLKAETKSLLEALGRHRSTLEVERGLLQQKESDVEKMRTQIKAKQVAVAEAESAVEKKLQESAKAETVDIAPLKKKLSDLEQSNYRVRQNAAKLRNQQAVAAKRAKSKEFTAQLEAIEAAKAKMLSETKFPIEGLSFGEHGVTYNGLPFGQASQAEQLRVSVAIAAAMNPKLRVMLIRDGEKLDDNGLALLEKLAVEFDLQIWLERVGKRDKCAIIIEDGEVEGAGPVVVQPELVEGSK